MQTLIHKSSLIRLQIFVILVASIVTIMTVIEYSTVSSIINHNPRGFQESSNYLMDYRENIDFGSGTYKAFWIRAEGTFKQRVWAYNKGISTLRKMMIDERVTDKWKPPSENLDECRCGQDSLKRLENYTQVKTVALSWHNSRDPINWDSRLDSKNILIKDYYRWTGCDILCDRIRNPKSTVYKDYVEFDRKCSVLNDTASLHKQSLETVYFHKKILSKKHFWPNGGKRFPDYFYQLPPPQVFYLHIIEDVVITDVGDIISGNLYLMPPTCHLYYLEKHHRTPRRPKPYEKLPLYNEVFIISQFWGGAYFHFILENLPRIAPYLEFLHTNPNIFIHVMAKNKYTLGALEILKINNSRLITGPVRALRTFLPEGNPCLGSLVQSEQLLSNHFNNYIQSNHTRNERGSILLIKRSHSRILKRHSDLMKDLKQIADEYELDFEEFSDNPVPSMRQTALMFRRAILVVAPHGAGLSNAMFCKPGTLILEALCDPPKGNLCFLSKLHVLGHRYHGITSKKECRVNSTYLDIDYKLLSEGAVKLLNERLNSHGYI